jgi:hypothetical protein
MNLPNIPVSVDAAGSGLYRNADDTIRAYIDHENPEGRWIRDQVARAEAEAAWLEAERLLEDSREAERGSWTMEARDDRRRENDCPSARARRSGRGPLRARRDPRRFGVVVVARDV